MRSAPNYTLAKAEARNLLSKYGIEFPPVDPVSISRQEGLDVVFVRFSGEFSEVAGFYDPRGAVIFVNKNEYPLRQTFTIAHELGHAKLHKEWASSDEYRVFWRDPSRNTDDMHEKESNSFAANLLVPRFMLDLYYKNLSETDLSRLFAVSVPVIRNRLAFEYGL